MLDWLIVKKIIIKIHLIADYGFRCRLMAIMLIAIIEYGSICGKFLNSFMIWTRRRGRRRIIRLFGNASRRKRSCELGLHRLMSSIWTRKLTAGCLGWSTVFVPSQRMFWNVFECRGGLITHAAVSPLPVWWMVVSPVGMASWHNGTQPCHLSPFQWVQVGACSAIIAIVPFLRPVRWMT